MKTNRRRFLGGVAAAAGFAPLVGFPAIAKALASTKTPPKPKAPNMRDY